jgi:ComF family protein
MSLAEKARTLGGLENLLEFVFPSLCLICSDSTAKQGDLICPNCWAKSTNLPISICSNCLCSFDENLTCPKCNLGDYFPVAALGHYIDPLKEIIHQFKYGGYRKLGVLLAEEWLVRYRPQLDNLAIDCVIPIPLDSYRERKRGFNQAAVLSDIIASRLNLAPAEISLMKVRRTEDQTRLNPERREINMHDAFRVTGDDGAGKRILLVDDVVTTGATLREAIRALSEAGTRPIMAAAIAITM